MREVLQGRVSQASEGIVRQVQGFQAGQTQQSGIIQITKSVMTQIQSFQNSLCFEGVFINVVDLII